MRGHLNEGWERIQRVLALPGLDEQPLGVRARALGAAGSIAYWRADPSSAHPLYRDALDLARRSGDPAVLAEALYNFGFASRASGTERTRMIAGRPFFEEAADLYRRLSDRNGVAAAAWALADSYIMSGDFEAARSLVEESLAMSREADNRFGIGWAFFGLANIEYRTGQMHSALGRLVEALRVFADAGDLSGVALCLFGMSIAARESGAWEPHLRLAGATEALAAKVGVGMDAYAAAELGIEMPARPTDDAYAQRAWDEGAAMSVDEAVSYALEVAALASGALPASP
jgi:tetratricopeptide (TPR) repeat protein